MYVQYYPNLCVCGCGSQIVIKKWHKWEGIPKYISGHNPKNKPIKHGGYKTKLYFIWHNMKDRCFNKNHQAYENYGGRGISICPEWTDKENGFINFRDWSLNNGYVEGLSIDRKESNQGYNPNNCQWITLKENGRKQRTNKLFLGKANEIRELYKTANYTQQQIAEKYNVSHSLINMIINNKRWL